MAAGHGLDAGGLDGPGWSAARGLDFCQPGTQPVSSARVWVSRSGSLTGPPLRPGQLEERIAVVEVLAACAGISMFFLLGYAGRRLINRQRLNEWEQAWRSTEPQWTQQR